MALLQLFLNLKPEFLKCISSHEAFEVAHLQKTVLDHVFAHPTQVIAMRGAVNVDPMATKRLLRKKALIVFQIMLGGAAEQTYGRDRPDTVSF